MPSIDELQSLARARHAAGDLAGAIELYEQIVVAQPQDAQAWYRFGAARFGLGQVEAAIANLARAVELRPDDAQCLCGLGAALAQAARLSDAEACFRRAVELDPAFVVARQNLGAVLVRQQKFSEAVSCCRDALALNAGDPAAHNNLAAALTGLGFLDEAAACCQQALQLAPDFAAAHRNLAAVRQQQGRWNDAEAGFRRVIQLEPQQAEAYATLAELLVQLRRSDEALACYRRALQLNPRLAAVHNNLGVALIGQDDYPGAESSFRQALALMPSSAELHRNLGTALVNQGRADEAVGCYTRAIELRPEWPDAHLDLATALFLLGRWGEAWPHYEWRFERSGGELSLAQPRWRGEPLAGRTILLHSEQGLGDTLQFVRYAELVKRQGAKVIVECKPQVASLLATCPGVDAVAERGQPLPLFDTYLQLVSLPAMFAATPDNVPAEIPYLHPRAELVERWRGELNSPGQLKVGIAWQGSKGHPSDRKRSIPLEHFAPLAAIDGVRLYSLQSGGGREQLSEAAAGWPIVDLGDRLGDFENTAAIASALDLVITCDSAPAHLAGAVGTRVWIALAHLPDWRWLLGRDDTPWYPTARLFRQSRPGDWPTVFARIADELRRLAAASPS